MLKRESLTKNFAFQFLYQVIILVIPLILSPFLTRTLQETALGTYSYVNSIAYYFVVLANLGISRHGQRIIARNSDNEIELRKSFWSLFLLHIIISLTFTLIYFLYISIIVKEDTVIYIIETFYVLSALFDITWLFYGLENFKSVVIKNGAVKIIECALIFAVVRTPSDLWKYTLISAAGIFIGQFVMIPQAIRLVKPIKFTCADCKQHVKPLLVFSISVIAATLYTVFDKTLLGILATKDDVAFYEYSNRIISVPKTVVSVIGTVMYPRACKMAANGDMAGQKRYIRYSIFFTALIGLGSIFGLCAVSQLFSDIYFGPSFAPCGSVMIALSPLVYIIGIGEIVRTQYMLPNGMEKQFNICTIISAVINIALSAALIPVVGIYGAIIGTLSAELFGLVYQLILCRNFIKAKQIISNTTPFIVIGLVMFIIIKSVSLMMPDTVWGLLIELAIGASVYLILTVLYMCLWKKDLWFAIMAKLPINK